MSQEIHQFYMYYHEIISPLCESHELAQFCFFPLQVLHIKWVKIGS